MEWIIKLISSNSLSTLKPTVFSDLVENPLFQLLDLRHREAVRLGNHRHNGHLNFKNLLCTYNNCNWQHSSQVLFKCHEKHFLPLNVPQSPQYHFSLSFHMIFSFPPHNIFSLTIIFTHNLSRREYSLFLSSSLTCLLTSTLLLNYLLGEESSLYLLHITSPSHYPFHLKLPSPSYYVLLLVIFPSITLSSPPSH